MHFLIDENLPRSLTAMLRETGHDVVEVVEARLRGADDEILWRLAGRQHRVLITRDLDFPIPDVYPEPAGLVLIRVPDDWTGTQIISLVRNGFHQLDMEQLRRRITVLTPGQIRTHVMD